MILGSWWEILPGVCCPASAALSTSFQIHLSVFYLYYSCLVEIESVKELISNIYPFPFIIDIYASLLMSYIWFNFSYLAREWKSIWMGKGIEKYCPFGSSHIVFIIYYLIVDRKCENKLIENWCWEGPLYFIYQDTSGHICRALIRNPFIFRVW